MKIFNRIISNKNIIILVFILSSVVTSTHLLLIRNKTFKEEGKKYTYYNNYQIYKYSCYHLIGNKDLYQPYPEEHWDLFKYSPAFALFFGVFAVFPDFIGLNLWNLLNALILLIAVYSLPNIDNRNKGFILLACLIELITSMQNSQSNALIAGLLILSFGSMERGRYWISTLLIVLSVSIKLFGIFGFLLFLSYPKKWKSALYSLIWLIVMSLIPLVAIDFTQLKSLYSSWYHLLIQDHSSSSGLSLIGLLHSWFQIPINKLVILFIGIIILCIPFIRAGKFRNYLYRLLILTSVLIWVVIFNHRAESNTYIIAFAGISIWYFSMTKTPLNTVLFIFAFIFISLSPTDIIPREIRLSLIEPYMLKVLPAVIIWLKITCDMLIFKENYQNTGTFAANNI
jgi:hypothetical protein